MSRTLKKIGEKDHSKDSPLRKREGGYPQEVEASIFASGFSNIKGAAGVSF
jgi:hypothetical protein